MQVEILKTSKDGHTGYVTCELRILDNGTVGATEKFGAEALEIVEKYNGNVKKWIREALAPGLKSRHISRTAVHSNLSALKGKILDI